MAQLAGVYKDRLIVADWGGLSFWDVHTLKKLDFIDFPTGRYNGGVLLHENILFSNDSEHVYMAELG
jgi:hypothetical protein